MLLSSQYNFKQTYLHLFNPGKPKQNMFTQLHFQKYLSNISNTKQHYYKLFAYLETYKTYNNSKQYSLTFRQLSNLELILNYVFTQLLINEIKVQPDYYLSLDFNLLSHLNIFTPWTMARAVVLQYTKQLQRIKNKNMQNNWINTTRYFNSCFIYLGKYQKIAQLQYFNTYNFKLCLKGRAVDLRRVSSRISVEPYTYYWTKGMYTNFNRIEAIDFFTTKWGITSFRVSFNYLTLQGFTHWLGYKPQNN